MTEAGVLPDDVRAILADKARAASVAPPHVGRTSLADGAVSALVWHGDHDAGAAPYAVFLHGAGLNAHSWDATLLRLGIGALVLDLPGHGDSAWRDNADYRPETIAPIIDRALTEWEERTGAGPRVLIGQSLGGLTAIRVAALNPERTAGVVLVDITPGASPATGSSRVLEFLAGPPDFGSVEEIVDRAVNYGIGHDRDALTRGTVLNTRRTASGRLRWKHHLAQLIAAGRSPIAGVPGAEWEAWSQITAPALLIRGSTGMVTDENAGDLLRAAPGTLDTLLLGGHNIHEDDPSGTAGALRYFLRALA